MTIRAARRADVPRIAAIEAVVFGSDAWAADEFRTSQCLVAEAGGKIEGYLVSRRIAPGEREILNLAVRPDRRRRGIALQLLQRELSRAATFWYLEVRESNTAARALYASAGFRMVGRRPDYYDHPREAAVIMRKP